MKNIIEFEIPEGVERIAIEIPYKRDGIIKRMLSVFEKNPRFEIKMGDSKGFETSGYKSNMGEK